MNPNTHSSYNFNNFQGMGNFTSLTSPLNSLSYLPKPLEISLRYIILFIKLQHLIIRCKDSLQPNYNYNTIFHLKNKQYILISSDMLYFSKFPRLSHNVCVVLLFFYFLVRMRILERYTYYNLQMYSLHLFQSVYFPFHYFFAIYLLNLNIFPIQFAFLLHYLIHFSVLVLPINWMLDLDMVA